MKNKEEMIKNKKKVSLTKEQLEMLKEGLSKFKTDEFKNEFDIVDFCEITTEPISEVLTSTKSKLTPVEFTKLSAFLSLYERHSKQIREKEVMTYDHYILNKNTEELQLVTNEEKEDIINHIKEKGYPETMRVYNCIANRYVNDNLDMDSKAKQGKRK